MSEESFTPALLRDIAGSVDQMKWPVRRFANNLLSSGDEEIRAFLDCSISSMWAYHQATHDYVLLCINQSPRAPFTKEVWIRCERHPGPYTGGPLFLSCLLPGAADTIQLSYEVEHLRAPDPRDKLIMAAAHGPATMRHFVDLLQIIQKESPSYGLASANCWWFVHVIFGTLHTYNGGVWMSPPEQPILKKIVLRFGRDTKEITENVGRRFSDRWPPLNGQRAPLNESRAWQGATKTPDQQSRRSFLKFPILRRNTTDSISTIRTQDDAPRLDWGPPATPTESILSWTLPEDTLSLHSVIRRVMTRAEPNNGEVLLTVYNAFTTGIELFNCLSEYYCEVASSENKSLPAQLRIEDFMREWATNEFLDMSVLHLVLDWLQGNLPPDARNRLLTRRGRGSISDQGSFIAQVAGEQLHADEGTLVRLSSSELNTLALELRANEYRLRSSLTPLNLMQVLARHADDPSPKLRTSLNTRQIRCFVARMVLSGGIKERYLNYRRVVKLAKCCWKDRNFASAQDLVDALDMSFIADLKRTRELAGKDNTLSKIRKGLPSRHSAPSPSTDDGGALYSLASYETELIHLFKGSFVDGQISWSTCRQLWEALRRVAPPSPTVPNPTQLHTFLTSALSCGDSQRLSTSIEDLARDAQSREAGEYQEWISNS